MGFMKPSAPATVTEPPPVVAESADKDTQAANDQAATHRKGLLSTILSRKTAAPATTIGGTSAGSQSTLG